MKDKKDKNIVRLLLIFIAYYCISFYFSHISGYGKVANLFIKDLAMIAVAILIYFGDIRKDFKKTKRSKKKYKYLLWSIGIYAAIILINAIIYKFYPNIRFLNETDKNNLFFQEYLNISIYYVIFKVVIFTAIVETTLYNLSFRKVLNNDVFFIVVSALVYTYFNYLFTGFNKELIIGALIIRFIPCCLYNFAYIKNDNNIVALMVIIAIRNIISLAASLMLG